MDEKNWRVKKLEESYEKLDKRTDELEKFKYTTVERLTTIFKRLETLESSNKWVSQSFFYLILSGVIGAVFFLFQWLITG